jgi:hypothetical protein
MHPGLLCYLHTKNGWLPVYPSVSQMPVEVGSVFMYCLTSDQAAQEGDKLLRIAQASQQKIWKDVGKG